jgi:hypothetical protein
VVSADAGESLHAPCTPPADPRLAHVVAAWESLPEHVKQTIDMLVSPSIPTPATTTRPRGRRKASSS